MVRVARKEIDLRETILDAAEALLGRTGFRKTTMEEIAREAGIGKGTTYLYFPSKDEVFLATIDRIADRLCDRLRAIAGEPAALDERLRRMLVERVLFRFDAVSTYPASLDEIFGALRLAYLDRRALNFRKEVDLFAAALAESSPRVADPVDAAEALVEATNALLPYALSPRELGDRDEVARRAARVARAIVSGVLTPSEPTSRRTRRGAER